jgi:hypothetical protein
MSCTVTDLLVADRWNACELCSSVFIEVVELCEEIARPSFMQLAVFDMLKKQHFEIFSRVGLCDPPTGSLCLTFCEMAKSSHEQSARATILNRNRPEPLADGGLDCQKVTTR